MPRAIFLELQQRERAPGRSCMGYRTSRSDTKTKLARGKRERHRGNAFSSSFLVSSCFPLVFLFFTLRIVLGKKKRRLTPGFTFSFLPEPGFRRAIQPCQEVFLLRRRETSLLVFLSQLKRQASARGLQGICFCLFFLSLSLSVGTEVTSPTFLTSQRTGAFEGSKEW